jgi:hypothetical protein
MKVKELIKLLEKQDPEAKVEVEMDDHGDRAEVVKLQPTFYNDPKNKWVVIHGDR